MEEQELRKAIRDEVHKQKETVENDPHRQAYHLMAPVGLINDPNGLIKWGEDYHLFFQWSPFQPGHGTKVWGHYHTKDFVNYTLEEPALVPTEWYDKDGCFSGSAVEEDGKLYLFYTGNTEENGDILEEYQTAAVSEDGNSFRKQGVLIEKPEGITPHFRDPKVWKEGDTWYMVVGAQTEDRRGAVLLYTSEDLQQWTYMKRLAEAGDEEGYMWECPDFFRLDGLDILLFSPQGIEPDDIHFHNVYQSGYVIGRTKGDRWERGDFHELDHGFEFYAPQTFEADGRRIMIGWMGVPDQYEEAHPTVANQWIHSWTIPRELTWNGERIVQTPIMETKAWRTSEIPVERTETIENDQREVEDVGGRVMEVAIDFEEIGDMWAIELYHEASLSYKKSRNLLTLSRPHPEDAEKTQFRHVQLDKPLKSLRMFFDYSSFEVFVNEGEEVFTSRIFADAALTDLAFTSLGTSTFHVKKWELAPIEIDSKL
ncbi:glycoside hydrolase family 32 protein [Salimicrobium halophilum]|uniref:Sucrose-6-phosphate hydrolase n=1 Tax=Salimicrobium halophilum TaxID=86666 RepID=A0A1G8STM4_9BACI|nr:sucrose-6-phosphate hydrolase [Salimicrobium halophilum]SDJ32513.1 beta-fructofuranosidase [Salimicrobium halophilum]